MVRGCTFEESMLQAGYSQTCAKRGKASLSKECLDAWNKALHEKSAELRQFGATLTPQEQEQLVRGRLAKNTIEGTDAGTQSAKLLGSDRRVSMWQPDSISGVVIIEAPPALPPTDNLPVLEGEVVEPKQLPAHVRSYVSKEDIARQNDDAYWRALDRKQAAKAAESQEHAATEQRPLEQV
jgi:hypothetical protein